MQHKKHKLLDKSVIKTFYKSAQKKRSSLFETTLLMEKIWQTYLIITSSKYIRAGCPGLT